MPLRTSSENIGVVTGLARGVIIKPIELFVIVKQRQIPTINSNPEQKEEYHYTNPTGKIATISYH